MSPVDLSRPPTAAELAATEAAAAELVRQLLSAALASGLDYGALVHTMWAGLTRVLASSGWSGDELAKSAAENAALMTLPAAGSA